MTDQEIKQLIKDTADSTAVSTVERLRAAGLLRDSTTSPYKKTEELLRQYPRLKGQQDPYACTVCQEVEVCLAEAANEPYAQVINLFYFEGNKNAVCANLMRCDERTCRKQRKKLVQQFSVRLASDEFIRELLV